MKHIASLLLVSASLLHAEPAFEVWSFTERALFPSALISTATVDWNGDEETAEDKKGGDDAEAEEDDLPIYGDENGWQKEFQQSLKTFSNALETGIASLEEHSEQFDSGEDPNIQMISVADARELGIMPIASGGHDK